MTESRNKFNHRTMTDTKLSNASGDHVHQDLLIRNNFRRSLNEMCFHNSGNARIRLTELNSERGRTLIPFREIAAGKLADNIVHDCQNTIGKSRCCVSATPPALEWSWWDQRHRTRRDRESH